MTFVAKFKKKFYFVAAKYFRFFANFSFKRWNPRIIAITGSAGKTTMLRDLARLLSNEGTQSVALIDERGELAACVNGEPQNDVGLCDVYDGYPKAEAIRQAVRSMAPQLILCDEIGGSEDAAAVAQCQNCGVRVIATAHAGSMEELRRRKPLQAILDSGAFSVFVFLKGHEQAGQTAYVVSEGVSDAA